MVVLLAVSVCSSQNDGRAVIFSKLDHRLQSLLQSWRSQNPSANSLAKSFVAGDNLGSYRIIVYTRGADDARRIGIRPNTVEPEFFTARATPDQIARLSTLESTRFIASAKRYKPLLDKSVPEIGADRLQSGQVNGTPYTGKNVIVGIIDTGIDWKHLDFRSATDTTKSRILSMWDQTLTGSVPAGFTYGAEYTQAQINDELDGTPADVVKEVDDEGHGTHVAGIAAGNGSSSASGYIGVAPEADLIIVRTSFTDADIIDGITYVRQKAVAAGKPFVINLSLGSHEGPHDGTGADELAIDDELATPGRAIVVAAGNEGEDAIHADSSIAQGGSINLQFTIPSYTATTGTQNDLLSFDMWYNAADSLTLAVTSPNGSMVTAASSTQTSVETSTNDGAVQILNAPSGPNPLNNAKNCTIDIFDNTAIKPPRAGTWTIIITGASVTQGGAFDIWLSRSEIQGIDGSFPEFTSGYSFRKLVGSPGTSKRAITVGSYVTRWTWKSIDDTTYQYNPVDRTNDYSTFSSMGPTRDGRQKPDVCAPGEVIVSTHSENSSSPPPEIVPDGKHVVMQGTSMAAPHVAGVAALLLQAKPTLTSEQLKNAIASTARRDAFTNPLVNSRWGYGKVDAAAAMSTVLSVRKISDAMPASFSLEQNYPNPFNPSTRIHYELPAQFHGIVTLTVFDLLGKNVATLVNEFQQGGVYSTSWNAETASSGVYYCILRAGGYLAVKKMILMR